MKPPRLGNYQEEEIRKQTDVHQQRNFKSTSISYPSWVIILFDNIKHINKPQNGTYASVYEKIHL